MKKTGSFHPIVLFILTIVFHQWNNVGWIVNNLWAIKHDFFHQNILSFWRVSEQWKGKAETSSYRIKWTVINMSHALYLIFCKPKNQAKAEKLGPSAPHEIKVNNAVLKQIAHFFVEQFKLIATTVDIIDNQLHSYTYYIIICLLKLLVTISVL